MSSIKCSHPVLCKKLDQLPKLDKSKSWLLLCGLGMTSKTNVQALLTIPSYMFMFVSKHIGISLE